MYPSHVDWHEFNWQSIVYARLNLVNLVMKRIPRIRISFSITMINICRNIVVAEILFRNDEIMKVVTRTGPNQFEETN